MEKSYKEKYEQALERCRKLYNEAKANEYTSDIEDYETIFPELAESEDEKIRKMMIRYFESCGNLEWYDGLTPQKAIAWLEKQAKQKQNFCHHEVDLSECSEEYRKAYYDGWNNCNMQHSQCKSESNDVVKCLINGMKFYYEDNEEATWGTDKWSMPVKHIIEVLEKQGEQKPEENKGNLGGISPNWSEEEEAVLDALIRRLEGEDIYVSPHLAVGCLKSLKDRVLSQPKQEWSEEDKYMYDILCGTIENTDINENTKYKLISWLKSLRPQNTWKPSELQLGCLSDAIEHYNSLGYPAPKLKELLDDLKKIKEE